ncbi:inorganic pyrophosphatase 1-like [Iris pallida]|uniref:Inorganic pyrophosphatase 1-like n=1 Tax=Iris pallida TaxID=29817 RepID=A0AAX6G2P7_IRIPA|nr:inorganic pyrophosphatase 1-like [Iris pallida]
MAGIVVVFDFDLTILDVDSDNWVIDECGATELFESLLPTTPWNSLMDRMMRDIHSKGRTIEDIGECLKRAPLDPHIIEAIKSAHALGCDLRVVSDANRFFIEMILKHHGFLDCFSEINTNPSYVDEEGRLRILPFHDDATKPSHGCSLCPPNMCKGAIIERIRSSLVDEGKKKVQFIYVGDGKGDYCPSLKLSEADCVMPRKNYAAWDLITGNIDLIKAKVHEWRDGEDLQRVLLQLIHRSERLKIIMDCKHQTSSSHEALPQALPVPH